MCSDLTINRVQDALDAAIRNAGKTDLSWLPERSGPWSLAPKALALVGALMRELRPANVLEFGCGVSTQLFARCAASLGLTCRIRSIDHDPEFGPRATEQVGLSSNVSFHQAPLVAREIAGRALPTYHLPADAVDWPAADLILIDGPPKALGGREGILYQALDFCRPGTLVLLDDAARAEEQRALARWADNLGDAIVITHLPRLERGMAAITLRERVPLAALESHRMMLSIRQLRSRVQDSEFVLVDDEQWSLPPDLARRRRFLLEHDRVNWGAPSDDAAAIEELRRRQNEGVRFLVFGQPAFWWCDYYSRFYEYVQATCRCLLRSERLVVFEHTHTGLKECSSFASSMKGADANSLAADQEPDVVPTAKD